MKVDTAQCLMLAAVKLGEECRKRMYVGRGMYGEQTTAIVVPRGTNWPAIAMHAAAAISDEAERSTFISEVSRLVSDNLGHETIYY